jgi:MYXO-CTERM domain-containing protein
MLRVSLAILLASSLAALPAAAAGTVLEVNPAGGGAAYEADYSQAVLVTVKLTRADGSGVVGERVNLKLQRGDDADTEFLFDDPVTAADGSAVGRLTLVNGRHGGQTFVAAAPTTDVAGERYVITATFLGDSNALGCDTLDAGPAADAGADAGADGGVADDTLCDAEATGELFVALEDTKLAIEPGNEVQLGETLRVLATLVDDNGDAEEAGTDLDGPAPVPLSGKRVSFFYDVSGNGRPELNERIQCANTMDTGSETNAQGIAACDFFADPSFVDTVNVADGLHAQFAGDEQYALSGAAQSIIVAPGPPDPARSLIEATPESLPADGFSLVEIRATLVDAANNLLGVDDPAYGVSFTTDLGTLEGDAERDPVTGQYLQTLKTAPRPGTATVQIVVDGAPGADVRVTFEDRGGCTCDSASPTPTFGALGLLLLFGLALGARRERR